MGVCAGIYMYDVVVKSSRSLSHRLMSSCLTSYWRLHVAYTECHRVACIEFRKLSGRFDWIVWTRRWRRDAIKAYLQIRFRARAPARAARYCARAGSRALSIDPLQKAAAAQTAYVGAVVDVAGVRQMALIA